MKLFINLEFSDITSEDEKEREMLKIFELLSIKTKNFCLVNKHRLHDINSAIYEAIYNSMLHGGAKGFLRVKIGLLHKNKSKLVFFISDNGNFYNKKDVRKFIREKNIERLIKFKPHKKSCGNGFEIIFKSIPKTRILNGTFYLIWKDL